jgi:Caspase domain
MIAHRRERPAGAASTDETGRTSLRSLAKIMLLTALLAAPLRLEAAERVALVIGNNDYSGTAALTNPVHDATAIAGALEKLGFSVLLATDVDRTEMVATIGEFSRRLTPRVMALVFYAGHAVQIDGQNFILPTDVKATSKWDLQHSAIDIQEVVGQMERLAGVSIVILDSCRDNPFLDQLQAVAGNRSIQVHRGLGPMQLRGRGAIIAYAAASGAVASDGDGEHSPYTAALLKEMGAPGVELGLMFRRVTKRVIDATHGEQRPELLVRLVDEVYLNPGDRVPEAEPAAPVAANPPEEPKVAAVPPRSPAPTAELPVVSKSPIFDPVSPDRFIEGERHLVEQDATVFDQPGVGMTAIGRLRVGDFVDVLPYDSTRWRKVRLKGGKNGYVKSTATRPYQ